MSNYYKEKRRMFIFLENILKKNQEKKQDIDLKRLIYQITLNHEVSDKAIIKRLKLIQDLNNEFKLSEDLIEWN